MGWIEPNLGLLEKTSDGLGTGRFLSAPGPMGPHQVEGRTLGILPDPSEVCYAAFLRSINYSNK